MTGDQRNRFQSLFDLCELSWRQFNERRTWEFKISVTIWTALALAIAGSVSVEEAPGIPGGRVTLSIGATLILALHLIWCVGLARAQDADRRIAIFYERELQRLAERSFDQDKDLAAYLEGLGKVVGHKWSYVLQLGVTALLATTLVLVNWERLPTSRSKNGQAAAISVEQEDTQSTAPSESERSNR